MDSLQQKKKHRPCLLVEDREHELCRDHTQTHCLPLFAGSTKKATFFCLGLSRKSFCWGLGRLITSSYHSYLSYRVVGSTQHNDLYFWYHWDCRGEKTWPENVTACLNPRGPRGERTNYSQMGDRTDYITSEHDQQQINQMNQHSCLEHWGQGGVLCFIMSSCFQE